MEKKGRSVTAEAVAIQQTMHQILDAAPKIVDDPISPRLIDRAGETYKNVAAISNPRAVRSDLPSGRCSSCGAATRKTV